MNKDKQGKGKLISFLDSNMKLLVSMYRTENDKQLHLPLSRVMSATHAEETSCISGYHCMSNVLFPRGYKQETNNHDKDNVSVGLRSRGVFKKRDSIQNVLHQALEIINESPLQPKQGFDDITNGEQQLKQ